MTVRSLGTRRFVILSGTVRVWVYASEHAAYGKHERHTPRRRRFPSG